MVDTSPDVIEEWADQIDPIPPSEWSSAAFRDLSEEERCRHVLIHEHGMNNLFDLDEQRISCLVALSGRFIRYDPFETYPELFMEFSFLELSAPALENFASSYGSTFDDEISATPLQLIRNEQLVLRDLVKEWQDIEQRGDAGKFIELYNATVNDRSLMYPLSNPRLVAGPDPEKPRFTIEATSLLDGMIIQLGQFAATQTKLKACEWCGRWFAYGTGTGRRRSAQFCSDRCRQAAYRHNKESNK